MEKILINNQSAASARALRGLYLVRTAFQLIWATGVLSTAVPHPAVAAALLIAYPLWDVACTIYDLRASQPEGSALTSQRINALLGLLASAGIAATAFSKPGVAIAVFGAWACGAGLLQLAAGLIRRKQLGGQWAMILSGTQSTAAGVAFMLGGLSGKVHASNLGGYAIFGAAYFLIGAVLLSFKLSRATAEAA